MVDGAPWKCPTRNHTRCGNAPLRAGAGICRCRRRPARARARGTLQLHLARGDRAGGIAIVQQLTRPLAQGGELTARSDKVADCP